MVYSNIPEEELKTRIGEAFFAAFDCATIIGKIDFCVTQPFTRCDATETAPINSLLWAEAKRGIVTDIYKPMVQLILTIGKARTFDTYLPPPFLAAFDAEKIAFLPYREILPFLALNDFNWNVAPSDASSREFGLLYGAVKDTLECTSYIFYYDAQEAELREFIKQHLSESSSLIQINKNNFVSIYQRWLALVQPSIDVDWEGLKKRDIIDGDFFLADLLSSENQTIRESLYVLLRDNHYTLDRKVDISGLFLFAEVHFKDNQKAHRQFWSIYKRPPREEFWDYLVNRRDLLVPQDLRERKGSFFTPQRWVELSQQYLADELGENWQEEYVIWDCAAGTGNLLNGLTNRYNIWASTLDKQDVDVMHDRIEHGANLLHKHVFQFDFLNDSFDNLPEGLRAIVSDSEKRKKLVIYINPPYVEGDARLGRGRRSVHASAIHERYKEDLGKASAELFAQFIYRIYKELPNCILGHFSKLKHLQAPNFKQFRRVFQPKLCRGFLIPANTFDNVKGHFPIGFYVWDTSVREEFKRHTFSVFGSEGESLGRKVCSSYDGKRFISQWLAKYSYGVAREDAIAHLASVGNDFQHFNTVFVDNIEARRTRGGRHTLVSAQNLLVVGVYVAVRQVIRATWLNDRDQFLWPTKGWLLDAEFVSNCLVNLLFTNNIQSSYGVNHFIPFTESEVDAQEKFESHFMTDFMAGKLSVESEQKHKNLLGEPSLVPTEPLLFSPEATAVFAAGKELWRYYHTQPDANPNASYYDIRAYFQGRNAEGKMNAKSSDATYNQLLSDLRAALEQLRLAIVPKVYAYGFLEE